MAEPTTEEIVDGLIQIQLPGWSDVGVGARPTNVWLVEGELPALIGAGHPAQNRALLDALKSRDISPSNIRRIAISSWSPSVLAGCTAFPAADWFVTSPDMIRPHAWNEWNDGERARFLGLADEVFERVDIWDRADLDPWLERAYPSVTNHLEFIPLRSGQSVQLGPFELEVVAAPGPNPGHAVLWEAEHGLLFAGELEPQGLPSNVNVARDYLVALERAAELEPRWFLPIRGESTSRGAWTLKRMIRFCGNYLSNIAPTLAGGKSLMEIVDADLGHMPEHPVVYLEALRRQRPFLDELVASKMIKAEAEGLDRRYGVDVEDTRFTRQ